MKKQSILAKLFLLALVLLYLLVFRNFPYLNLILQIKLIGGLILVLAIFLFDVGSGFLAAVGFGLLLVSLGLALWGRVSLAESVGELIYILLIIVFFKKLNDFRRLV